MADPLTPRSIPESTIGALSELLVRMVHEEPHDSEERAIHAGDGVRRALRSLCDDARSNDVRIEQVVIAIKQGWSELHREHPRTRASGPDALLNHVITLCIDEYYVGKAAG